jgi:hypothetical protein
MTIRRFAIDEDGRAEGGQEPCPKPSGQLAHRDRDRVGARRSPVPRRRRHHGAVRWRLSMQDDRCSRRPGLGRAAHLRLVRGAPALTARLVVSSAVGEQPQAPIHGRNETGAQSGHTCSRSRPAMIGVPYSRRRGRPRSRHCTTEPDVDGAGPTRGGRPDVVEVRHEFPGVLDDPCAVVVPALIDQDDLPALLPKTGERIEAPMKMVRTVACGDDDADGHEATPVVHVVPGVAASWSSRRKTSPARSRRKHLVHCHMRQGQERVGRVGHSSGACLHPLVEQRLD